LPAASCVLLNAPAAEACKPNCCANKTCCATSRKTPGPVSPSLFQTGDGKQQQVIGFDSVPVLDSSALVATVVLIRLSAPARAHSPPPLATTCIRLI
jgi:hypothetical protein